MDAKQPAHRQLRYSTLCLRRVLFALAGWWIAGEVPLAGAQSERNALPVVFVQQDATGADDGSSWTDAYTDLQTALSNVNAPATIWVASGVYLPGTLRASTFRLLNGIEIYGGFLGDEDPGSFDLRERVFQLHETILDGHLGSNLGDAFHVVDGSDTNASAVLDGFTITGGVADGLTATLQDVGGGALIVDGSPSIRNCVFIRNRAGTEGGALHIRRGSPTIVGCLFIDNRSTTSFGANNRGGAVFSMGDADRTASPILVNCIFAGNRAGIGAGGRGGAWYNGASSTVLLINCTFHANVADDEGGGVYRDRGSVTLTNCILWGNTDQSGTRAAAQVSGTANVSYSCVQDDDSSDDEVRPGSGNIDDDPMFVDPRGGDGESGTSDDDLHLAPSSPCIDAANSATVSAHATVDLDGNTRIVNNPNTPDTGIADQRGGVVDMGVFEFQAPCEADTDCHDNDPCTIDACELVTLQCVNRAIGCDDGIFCNGLESCVDGACESGAAPICNDGIACTLDTCNSQADACLHDPDPSACDNDTYCDGVEICDTTVGCLPGLAIECDDRVACTVDGCNESTLSCDHTLQDAFCDDGAFCNGAETCHVTRGCETGPQPCISPLICDETADSCVGCLVDGDCDDDNSCTVDQCAGGVCQHDLDPDCCREDSDCAAATCLIAACVDQACVLTPAANDTPCLDELFCNGDETCQAGICTAGTQPCGPLETCDEDNDRCRPISECVSDAQCDDGDVCTSNVCDPVTGTCVNLPSAACCRTDTECDDANPCSDDACMAGACVNSFNTNACDDGEECTTGDTCAGGVCAGVLIEDCGGPPPPPPTSDSDGDGVSDAQDACPGTPSGEPVDARGCACSQLDDDGDGVDHCDDLCPSNATKASPGHCGCGVPETDSDGDGVVDCIDVCPQTPAGAEVAENGCPLDPPIDQPIPIDEMIDEVEDGVITASTNDSTNNPAANENPDGLLDESLDQPVGLEGPRCGTCGALGMITWSAMLLGVLTLRAKPM